jgi:hypothetical protein
MKFNALYNYLFESKDLELPEVHNDDEPVPDGYDVEPAPVPTSPSHEGGTSIEEYIEKLETFADELNSTEGGSLQQYVNDIDVAGSVFQGISRETSSDIISIAESVRSLSETLKGFIINSSKRKRDIVAGNINQSTSQRAFR